MANEFEKRLRGDVGSGNVFNGSTKFVNAMLSINAALLTAAITGAIIFAVNMSGRMSAMEANVTSLTKMMDLVVSGHLK
jgi:hypothetical protein